MTKLRRTLFPSYSPWQMEFQILVVNPAFQDILYICQGQSNKHTNQFKMILKQINKIGRKEYFTNTGKIKNFFVNSLKKQLSHVHVYTIFVGNDRMAMLKDWYTVDSSPVDTLLLRTPLQTRASPQAKRIKKGLKQTHVVMDSHYYGNVGTFMPSPPPKVQHLTGMIYSNILKKENKLRCQFSSCSQIFYCFVIFHMFRVKTVFSSCTQLLQSRYYKH